MSKVYFENEEECRDVFRIAGFSLTGRDMATLKYSGVIRKNPVEEFEEMYKEFTNSAYEHDFYEKNKILIESMTKIIFQAMEVIQYQKKLLEAE